ECDELIVVITGHRTPFSVVEPYDGLCFFAPFVRTQSDLTRANRSFELDCVICHVRSRRRQPEFGTFKRFIRREFTVFDLSLERSVEIPENEFLADQSLQLADRRYTRVVPFDRTYRPVVLFVQFLNPVSQQVRGTF